MSKKDSNLTKEELNLIEETERFMEDVNADPMVKDAELPPELYEKLMDKVRQKKAERAKEVEKEELVRLGKVYMRKRKARKYWVIAAAVVLVLALGITSVGRNERLAEIFHFENWGRRQTQVNSGEDTMVIDHIDEEEAYQQIEDMYGFYPVTMEYRPKGTEFLEMSVNAQTQTIILCYGREKEAYIIQEINPIYVDGSTGVDIEDDLEEEYSVKVDNMIVFAKRYNIKESQEHRWTIEFSYQNVRYFYRITNLEKAEIEKIIQNLNF